ncbi:hypothetical protein EUX98_g9354 [Antrodiella citrinella]|uniref:Uncharacterized protein n=1 Tax=Antrodiella citrinella TaxID=2447956 RepID=A0A4S4LVL0_9APHY|nr:hypothetical protein EUX98_g9354 [Antrodiella citrinella]
MPFPTPFPLPPAAVPLSASRRRRARSDSAESSEVPAKKKAYTDPLASIGGIFFIIGDMFYPIRDILLTGLQRSEDTDPTLYDSRENRLFSLFKILQKHRRTIIADLTVANDGENSGVDTLMSISGRLEAGRKYTKNACVHGIKTQIGSWFSGWNIPTEKSSRGFNHDMCGKMLCPVDYDWSDPAVKQSLRTGQGKYFAGPEDLCFLLWPENEYDADDPIHNFLRSRLIVKFILLGPNTATEKEAKIRGKVKSRAAHHGITSININTVVGCAVLVHYALSSQAQMSRGGTVARGADAKTIAQKIAAHGGAWPYETFYQTIIRFVTEMFTEDQRSSLEQWFTTEVFGEEFDRWDPLEEDEEEDPAAPKTGVLHRMVMMQKQVLREARNDGGE